MNSCSAVVSLYISTHAPARGATRWMRYRRLLIIRFLLTPPRGGRRQSCVRYCRLCVSFLLTPPRGGRLGRFLFSGSYALYFYSRPREGGDSLRRISLNLPSSISTHAPARGATHRLRRCRSCPTYFYSRPREGGDQLGALLLRGFSKISTHAPARGATAIFHKNIAGFCS